MSLADSKRLDNGLISETEIEISEEGISNSSAVLYPAGSVILKSGCWRREKCDRWLPDGRKPALYRLDLRAHRPVELVLVLPTAASKAAL